jgi:alkyl hydroperoxide reductase subunit AhpC
VGNFLLISVVLVWAAVLLNLALTLRLLRWRFTTHEGEVAGAVTQDVSGLPIGEPAPDFTAETLSGEHVGLDRYRGRSVAFVFSSPACWSCRSELPKLVRLAELAKKNADVEIVLVSAATPPETQEWLDRIAAEDGLAVTLPVLVSRPGQSGFYEAYDPTGSVPYFCLVDPDGRVMSRALLVQREWAELSRLWAGVTRLAPWMAAAV